MSFAMAKRRGKREEYFECPHCGARVRVGAAACPECGSDEETGWSENKWDADIPTGYGEEQDFDYDEFVEQEFPQHASGMRKKWFWRLVALLLVLMLLLFVFLNW